MKKISRRQFLKGSMMAGAYLAAGRGAGALWRPRRAYAFAQSPNLKKFISRRLRNPLTGGIPLAASDGVRNWPALTATGIPVDASIGVRKWGAKTATHYTIDISQFKDQLHPSLANATALGIRAERQFQAPGRHHRRQEGTPRSRSPSGTTCPTAHIIPVDTTIPGANQAPEPHGRPPPRRARPLDQRRRPLRLVGAGRHPRRQLPEQPGPEPRRRRRTRPSTTTPTTRAPGWCGTTTTPSASRASTPTRASPPPTSSRMTLRGLTDPQAPDLRSSRTSSIRGRSPSSSRTRSSSTRNIGHWTPPG